MKESALPTRDGSCRGTRDGLLGMSRREELSVFSEDGLSMWADEQSR